MGKNANNDYGFWITKPGINVHATASDPWGYQQEFKYFGNPGDTKWKKANEDNQTAEIIPLQTKNGNVLEYTEDWDDSYIYTADCAIDAPSEYARAADDDAITPFGGNTYPILEMNVRNTLWGGHSSAGAATNWKLSFQVYENQYAYPNIFDGGPYTQSIGFGTEVRIFINHPGNPEQDTTKNFPYARSVSTAAAGIDDMWEVGDILECYLANHNITVTTQITAIVNFRSFDLSLFGEYGFSYASSLGINDKWTNLSKLHPGPIIGDTAASRYIGFSDKYSLTLGSAAFSIQTFKEDNGVPGPWTTIEWDFDKLLKENEQSVPAKVWLSGEDILGMRLEFYQEKLSGTNNRWEVASIRTKYKNVETGLPAHPNSLESLLFTTGPMGPGGVQIMHAGLIHQTGIVKVGTSNDAVGVSSGVPFNWLDWTAEPGDSAGPNANLVKIYHNDGSTWDGSVSGAIMWSNNIREAFMPDDVRYKRVIIKILTSEYTGITTTNTIVKIQNLSLPGTPTFDVGESTARWESGSYSYWAVDVDIPGLTSEGYFQGDALGVVRLANPLPYIPFILFQRFDGSSSDPINSYPANQLDISYSGISAEANTGVLEHRSSHTDPSLWNGAMGLDVGYSMSAYRIPIAPYAGLTGQGIVDIPEAPGNPEGRNYLSNYPGFYVSRTTGEVVETFDAGEPTYTKPYGPLGPESAGKHTKSSAIKWGDWTWGGLYTHNHTESGTGSPFAFGIATNTAIIYKWMLMETFKFRTFAYCRAGKDRFEITARNALGIEGNEELSQGKINGKYVRAGVDNSVSGHTYGEINELEYMWDQKDDTANGVLPPSVYTAEFITDWGRWDSNPADASDATSERVKSRYMHTDSAFHGTGIGMKHEFLPGLHFGGTAGPSKWNKPPWDWGGETTTKDWELLSTARKYMDQSDVNIGKSQYPLDVSFSPSHGPDFWRSRYMNNVGTTSHRYQNNSETGVYHGGDFEHPSNDLTRHDGSKDLQWALRRDVYPASGTDREAGALKTQNQWPPGGLYMAAFTPVGKHGYSYLGWQDPPDHGWTPGTAGPDADGGYATEAGKGTDDRAGGDAGSGPMSGQDGIGPMEHKNYPHAGVVSSTGSRYVSETVATQGIHHPHGVSQYPTNVKGSATENQTYDLVHNNESTGHCTYRYYVLRIPANLNAEHLISNAGLIG
jgi:hypothetical protein